MTIRTDYADFLRARLNSRIVGLQAAFAALVADPPAIENNVEIIIFPDDGLTHHLPIRVFAFTPKGTEQPEESGIDQCNSMLDAMVPLITEEEAGQFQTWEGEGDGRMLTLEQPTDGIDEQALKSWVANTWLELDLGDYGCRTSVTIHDGDTEVISVP